MSIMIACKKNISTEATANLFFDHVSVHFGLPWTIISDEDNEFLITLSSMWSIMNINMTKSISFHPQTQWEDIGDQKDDCAYPNNVQLQTSLHLR